MANAIDPKWIINRQGKDMVLFVGLVHHAHQNMGLCGTQTDLVQSPTKDNGMTAIVTCTAQFYRMQDNEAVAPMLMEFSGIGDANPENVGKQIVPHIIRMAETRAIARALRVGTDIAYTCDVEFGEEEKPKEKMATEEQIGMVLNAQRKLGVPESVPAQCTYAWASTTIKDLKAKIAAKAEGK